MKTLWADMRCCLLGLPVQETGYDRRGFRGATSDMRARLEQVGAAFMGGYHAALKHGSAKTVTPALETVYSELRGFAYEGAAMGLALLDSLTPWPANRVGGFLAGAGDVHAYMVHVGVGWVWARVAWGRRRLKRQLDPLLCWLAYDGWGFHEGFFHWPDYLAGKAHPKRLGGYENRAFDQGLGRSLWFVNGGNVELTGRTIQEFASERQADLWSGIGLAATYAGVVNEARLTALQKHAGSWWPQLAQGAAFAAKARQRAGNLTDYTDLATRTLCGLSAGDAARLCDTTLENLPGDGAQPAYEVWRQRIQREVAGARTSGKREQSAITRAATVATDA